MLKTTIVLIALCICFVSLSESRKLHPRHVKEEKSATLKDDVGLRFVNCNLTSDDCLTDCTGIEDDLYQFCGNCSSFIVCAGETTTLASCPGDLHWDDSVKQCIDDSLTCHECHVPPKCALTGTGPTCIMDFECYGLPNDNYQLCANCTSYGVCTDGVFRSVHCPAGMVWRDSDPKGCAEDSDTCIECFDLVHCNSTGPSCFKTCDGLTPSLYQLCDNCVSFLDCQSTDPVYCPVGFYWDDDRRGCFLTSGTCEQCVIPDKCESTGTGCIKRCFELADGFYQSCANCSSYIECLGGFTGYHHCDDDWFWDDAIKSCVPFGLSSCLECEGRTTVAPSSTTSSLIVPDCGSILNHLVDHPELPQDWSSMCQLTRDDHPEHLDTQCRDLIVDLEGVGNADDLLAQGGNFGCVRQVGLDDPDKNNACRDNYQQSITLGGCEPCQALVVCIVYP